MEQAYGNVEFESLRPLKRLTKAVLINPLANCLPVSWLRGVLRFGKSELAAANWDDPGGWRSMVMSYEGRCHQIADKILIKGGTMAMALRNRKRLGARILADLIDEHPDQETHVLCLGAGPGHIITEAMCQASSPAFATLVDLNSDAFAYGRDLAGRRGVADRVRFVKGDVRDVRRILDRPPDVVKMLGICEYLTAEQIQDIGSAVVEVMPAGAPIVFNSLSKAHGTDRFFRRVFGLHMRYRTPAQLQRLLSEAGFADYVSIPEPLRVYHVVLGRRRQ